MNEVYKVYVRTDSNGNIIAVNSSAFIGDATGWTQIDEGSGDRCHHAQGHYFDGPLMTGTGVCRYKLADGTAVGKSAAEIDAEEAVILAARDKAAQIAALKEQLAATDYKIIKAYEYSLAGLPAPYDIAVLHAERQALRDEINLIEQGDT